MGPLTKRKDNQITTLDDLVTRILLPSQIISWSAYKRFDFKMLCWTPTNKPSEKSDLCSPQWPEGTVWIEWGQLCKSPESCHLGIIFSRIFPPLASAHTGSGNAIICRFSQITISWLWCSTTTFESSPLLPPPTAPLPFCFSLRLRSIRKQISSQLSRVGPWHPCGSSAVTLLELRNLTSPIWASVFPVSYGVSKVPASLEHWRFFDEILKEEPYGSAPFGKKNVSYCPRNLFLAQILFVCVGLF